MGVEVGVVQAQVARALPWASLQPPPPPLMAQICKEGPPPSPPFPGTVIFLGAVTMFGIVWAHLGTHAWSVSLISLLHTMKV